MVKLIRKRDNSLVKFDKNKIAEAIRKAFVVVNRKEKTLPKKLADKVTIELNKKFFNRVPSVEEIQDIVEDVLINNKMEDVAKAYILYRARRAKVREVKKVLGVSDDLKLNINAIRLMEKRYLLKDEKGRVIETPRGCFVRVAKAISSIDKKYGKDSKKSFSEFFDLLSKLIFIPNSPTLMNAGTKLGQLSACFVLPVEDSLESIFEAIKQTALIHQTGGGTGFSFSKLRPAGDVVRSTGGIASGPVSFMHIFDMTTDVIKQGGRRRGANMGILSVNHPDIIEFINAKLNPESLRNFNVSVSVSNSFMKAAREGRDYWLINPRTNSRVRKANAKEVFDLIADNAWRTGDPGVVFIDEIKKHNPTPLLGAIESTNPCLTKDTWVLTNNGPRQIKELINKKVKLCLNGTFYESSGFFSSGRKDIFKIVTNEGYEIRATDNHLFLNADKVTRYLISKSWKALSELSKGDYLIVGNNRGLKWEGNGTFEEAYLLGLLFGDGYVSKDKGVIGVWKKDKGSYLIIPEVERIAKKIFKFRSDFKGFQKENSAGVRMLKLKALKELAIKYGIRHENKKIGYEIENTSYDFHCGFLRGFFDTDGSVQGSQKKGVSIRLWQNDLETLKAVQRMLQRIGIISSLYKRKEAGSKMMPDNKGGMKLYSIKDGYELIISNDNISVFAKEINFVDVEKKNKLKVLINSYKRSFNKERFVVRVKEIIKNKSEDVYDVLIPGANCFDANGLIVHNCGEVPLLPFESCNLGSINLSRLVENGKINWQKLKEVVHIGVHFLDNVIDANNFPSKEIEKITRGNRKIGLGVMGFADMLIKLKIPYNSNEALSMAEKIIKFIKKEATDASVKLASERGSFPNFKGSTWQKEGYKKIRNATLLTIAPTGSISIVSGCSSGIEPLFAISFVRNVLEGTSLLEVNEVFEHEAIKGKFYSNELIQGIAATGSLQSVKGLPDWVKEVFVTAFDIGPEWHVKMQAVFQKYIDNAVSKTINFPNDASVNDVKKAYLLAYKLKCKGITTYRYGSKLEQVLYFVKDKGYLTADSEYSGGCPTLRCTH